jgi:minor extracellular serine protease Vpr
MTAYRMRARAFSAIAVVSLVFGAIAFGAGPASADDDELQPSALSVGQTDFIPLGARTAARIAAFVRLSGDPVAVVQSRAGGKLDQARKDAIKSSLKAKQDAIVPAIAARGGTVTAQLQSAINGVQVEIASSQLAALASLPDVVEVTPLATYVPTNSVSVPYIGAPATWDQTAFRGEGVKVAIIDTGIDFTHKNFGGPGTVEAFNDNAAKSTRAAPAGLFGPKADKVKGGTDLVGDAYNASSANPANRVPHPDPNPLDCAGHGSHVAGTAAGFGVRENGTTYKGPWTSAAYGDESFAIGPGVAPRADLYAVRVFGCVGSTNVVVQALDWAVDHDMDVVNMSLGSSYGRADSATALASDNASAAGIIVVASAGNSGTPRYILGAPSTTTRGISVAANDSTPTYPGATLALDTGKSVSALNENGATFADGSSWPVYVLRNTDGSISLGCDEAAYDPAVITGKLVLTARGTCARVARAVFGQKHGAAAVAMINNAAGYPPFDGKITGNPDTGEVFDVTIPFFGLRGPTTPATDGNDVAAAANATATNITINNPGFQTLASFTSNGPRGGDSSLKPDVTAPGVSILSTGVGTGNKGAVMSGTSMAAPHVAGVAALTRQAHATWSVAEIKAAIMNTADPGKVAGYQTSRAGTGLVQPLGSTTTSATALGDPYAGSLSFGFAEVGTAGFNQTKNVTINNHGATALTFTTSTTQNAPFTRAHTATPSAASVTVPAGGGATLGLTLSLTATQAGDSAGFREVAGLLTLTPAAGTNAGVVLRVPYYLVPRALSNLDTTVSPPLAKTTASNTATVSNAGGAIASSADLFTWGIADADEGLGSNDVRAVGVRRSGSTALRFAINTYRRWSAPNVNEFDIYIDLNGDGVPEYIVFTDDFGLVTANAFNGQYASFVFNVATGTVGPNAFLAPAPTDSSTVIAPVFLADIGLSAATHPRFNYTVAGFDLFGTGDDNAPSEVGHFNAFTPAISVTGTPTASIPAGGSATATITVNSTEWDLTPPKGLMVVGIDNAAGPGEAQTIPAAP